MNVLKIKNKLVGGLSAPNRTGKGKTTISEAYRPLTQWEAYQPPTAAYIRNTQNNTYDER